MLFASVAELVSNLASERSGGLLVCDTYWNDQNGPAAGIQSRFTSIDVVGIAASVRLDTDNWTGHRFTDFFNLVKIDGQWKVVSKVFYLNP